MRARPITTLSVALLTASLTAACLTAGIARADDLGPEPPSAPTPDEALSAAAPALPSPPPASPPAKPATAAATTPPAAAGAQTSPDATNETYRTKDGGMYQPPAVRPASPAMDTSHYGRT